MRSRALLALVGVLVSGPGCASLLGIEDTVIGDAAVDASPDDGGSDAGDGAIDAMVDAGPNLCGNGRVDPGEECDLGAANSLAGPVCAPTCQRLIVWSVNRVSHDYSPAFAVRVGVGGVAVTGTRRPATSTPAAPLPFEGWTMALTTTGVERWTRAFQGGTAAGSDYGFGVTVDEFGRVVAVGIQDQDAINTRGWVRAYDSTGGLLWTALQAGDNTLNSINAYDIDRTSGGFLVAARITQGAQATASILTVNDSGIITGNSANFLDTQNNNIARRVRAVDDGYVYAGWGTGTATMSTDAYARLGSPGGTRWTSRDTPTVGDDLAVGLDLAPGGDVVISGWGPSLAWVARLDPATGVQRWRRTMPAVPSPQSPGVACAPDGSCVVTWNDNSASGLTSGGHLRKFDSAGGVVWDRPVLTRTGGTTGIYAYSIDITPDGAIYVVGYEVFAGNSEALIRRYLP